MTKDDIKKLDELRKEESKLDYFLYGNGNFGIIKNNYVLFKNFVCGQHELKVTQNVKAEIIQILKDRLSSVRSEISEM